jgi:2-polyprenyl-3-methyl-5-hydroxy-6-metoxy-1,4-benzoquinol methylase
MNKYKQKERAYFTNVRHDIISLIPNKPDLKILEVGAGGGDTLMAIKERGLASEVIGIELNLLEGSNQNNPLISEFVFGDIEKMKLPFKQEYFDLIICGDVLEHLVDPQAVIHKLETYLSPGGLMIASLPNIRHYTALLEIFFKGNFPYTDYGLFDKTHLRFFCKSDMIKMFSTVNLKVEKIYPIFDLLPSSRVKVVNKITFGLICEFISLQFVLVARKNQ